MQKQILFSYGTLKRGHRNAAILDDQKYLGKAITLEQFKLCEVTGNYKFPALVNEQEYQVVGELYECSEKCMNYLDQIEGVGRGLYERRNISVKNEQGEETKAIAYFFLQETNDLADVGPCWPKQDAHFFQELYDTNPLILEE